VTIHRLRGSLQSLRSLLRLNVARAVLEKQLREVLRFEKGGVYSVQVCGAAAHELCDPHETRQTSSVVACLVLCRPPVMASCGVTALAVPPQVSTSFGSASTHPDTPLQGTVSVDFDCDPARQPELIR
jgi:hypothetical protein